DHSGPLHLLTLPTRRSSDLAVVPAQEAAAPSAPVSQTDPISPSEAQVDAVADARREAVDAAPAAAPETGADDEERKKAERLAKRDRKSTRLNSSHVKISYAV